MNKVNIAVGLFCVLVAACAETQSSAVPPSSAPANAAAAPADKASVETSVEASVETGTVKVGFTRGTMQDAQAQQWQADLLHAIGRDGQYSLFNYVFVQREGQEDIYVGLQAAPLELTPAQLDAANAVQKTYHATSMAAATRDGIWIANAWPESSKAVASAN
jgi:hypothetical protein